MRKFTLVSSKIYICRACISIYCEFLYFFQRSINMTEVLYIILFHSCFFCCVLHSVEYLVQKFLFRQLLRRDLKLNVMVNSFRILDLSEPWGDFFGESDPGTKPSGISKLNSIPRCLNIPAQILLGTVFWVPDPFLRQVRISDQSWILALWFRFHF